MQEFSQSPTDPEFIQDPYRFYHKTRAGGPMFFWTDYNMACATSYEAVNSLLRDRRLGREQTAEKQRPIPDHVAAFYAFEHHSMLEREPPTHTRLRGLVVRAFTSRRIKTMGPEISTLCHQLVDNFRDGTVDLLPAYAEKIPVIIIARLLGVPEEMADQLLIWSHDMVAMYQANRSREIEEAAVRATLEFSDFMRIYVDQRRKSPKDDLLSELIAAEEQGEKLSNDELLSTAILLLNAGHEATVHSIGNGVKCLLENNLNTAQLVAPEAVENTIEETLRIDPPLHMFTRFIYEDFHAFGHDFKRGDEVALMLAAANRDPMMFANPDQFQADRNIKGITSFGAGIHFCVGAPLARLEMQLAFSILFERCPNLRLDGPAVYADRYHFHGLTALPLRR
ncbi:MAG: cytochrome P450 [Paracoccaceae bacterium]|jgi:cytochrome P450